MIDVAISTMFALLGDGGSSAAAALELLKGLTISSVNKGLQIIKGESIDAAKQLVQDPDDEAARKKLQAGLQEILKEHPELGQHIQQLHQTYIHKVSSKNGVAVGTNTGTINITNK